LVKDGPADQLDVEVALADRAFRGLTDCGEGLGEKIVEVFSFGQALTELVGLRPKLGVRQRLEGRLEGVDGFDDAAELLDLPFLSCVENPVEDVRQTCLLRGVGGLHRMGSYPAARYRSLMPLASLRGMGCGLPHYFGLASRSMSSSRTA
jgi:hypothetical protein